MSRPDSERSRRRTIDGDGVLASAREIAFPRYPGTEGCERARAIVARWWREAGLEVSEEEFSYDIRPAFRAIRAIALVSGMLVGVAGLVAYRSDWAALVLVAAALLVGGALLAWAPWAEAIYGGEGPTRAANVLGRRRVENRRMTLILMAHYDSKSQNLTFPWRNGPVLLAILGTLGLCGLLLARVATGRPFGPEWLPAVAGGMAAVCLFLLSTLASGNESPGGVDNAGSVAIVRELARRLPSRVADDVDLVFLSTSAEEDHMIGAMRWLDRHAESLRGRPVYALNFDGAGAPGRPVILESYGVVHRFAPAIAKVAIEVARDLGLRLRRVWLPPAMGVDAIPFHHRGLPCLTFSSGSLDRATMSVHSRHDVVDHLDAGALADCATLGLEVATRLARRAEA